MKAVRSQYVSAKKLIKARQGKGTKLDILRDENLKWKKELHIVENRFLDPDKVNTFLKNMNIIAEKTKNRLMAIDPVEKELSFTEGFGEVGVKMTILGEYAAIINFLSEITAKERLLNITDFAIRKENNQVLELKASFVLTLFVTSDDLEKKEQINTNDESNKI